MENLLISQNRNGYEVFPHILLNADTGICSISGDSYMQNTKSFFRPVLDWFEEYTASGSKNLFLECQLSSFNTGTSRVLYELFEILKVFRDNGGDVNVKWLFDDQKETLADDIVDIISEFGIDIQVETF